MVDKAGSVADALADRPPVTRVGVGWMLGTDSPHAVEVGAIISVPVEQLVQPRIFKAEGAPVSIDLDCQVARPPDRGAGHLEDTPPAGREAHERRRGLVHGDRPSRALWVERFRLAAHLADRPRHPGRHVDEMAAEVGDGGPAHRSVEAPIERDRRIDELVGEPACPHQPDLPDSALVDHALHQRDRGQPAVVEPDRVEDVRSLHRVHSRDRLRIGHGERLLADDRLSGRGRLGGDLGVSARRRADVDDVDLRPPDQLAPIVHPALDSVRGGGGGHPGPVAAADHAQARPAGQLAHHRGDGVAVGVGLAHHPVPDDADPDLGAAQPGLPI